MAGAASEWKAELCVKPETAPKVSKQSIPAILVG